MPAYKYNGETFLLDDTEGCFVEVTYRDQMGWAGVNLNAPPLYAWYTERGAVTSDGLRFGATSDSFEQTLDALCADLLKKQEHADAQATVNRDAACEALHDFVDKLPI